MSAVTGVEYRIARERRELEAARLRWTALLHRRSTVARRAQAQRVTVGIPAAGTVGKTAATVRRACDALTQQLDAAERGIENQLYQRRNQGRSYDIADMIADADRQDAQARSAADAEQSARPYAAQTVPVESINRAEITRRVQAKVADAPAGDPDVERWARSALAATTPVSARLSLRELDTAVRVATERRERMLAQRLLVTDLQSTITTLLDPDDLPDRAAALEALIESGENVQQALGAMATEIADRQTVEQPDRDRRYVAETVANALADLGYATSDVALDTPDPLVFARPSAASHGVKVEVNGDEIEVRAVRLDDTATDADLAAAEEAFCDHDIAAIVRGVTEGGLVVGRVRSSPKGLVRPPLVTSAPVARKATPAKTKPTARQRDREAGAS